MWRGGTAKTPVPCKWAHCSLGSKVISLNNVGAGETMTTYKMCIRDRAYAEFSKEVLADGEKQRAKLQSSLSR